MSRCSICDHSCRFVMPSGPQGADIMAIGEKPGKHEANTGTPFVGDAGQELNQTYLYRAGLDRSDIRITNTVKCRLGDNNNKPTAAQIEGCGKHWLPTEMMRCQPQVLLLMGATACSLIPKIELDKQHGYPIYVEAGDSEFLGGWEGWAVPIYHPAAGMHNTSLMTPLLEDFERLGKWLKGKWQPPVRNQQETDYQLIETVGEFRRYVDCIEACLLVGLDTENDGPKPFSLQFSHTPLNGRMILAENQSLIREFRDWAYCTSADWYMHNRGHDLDVLDRMGVYLESRPVQIYDTMQEAYHLGNLPQKLKHLAWRMLGVQMRDWDEVVGPPSRKLMTQWMKQAWIYQQDMPIRKEKQLKTKVKVEWKPNDLEKALKRILSHSHKPAYNIWKKCQEAGVFEDEGMIRKLGRNPIMSIANAPLEEAVVYGCEDAAVTLEVAMELDKERERLMAGEWNVFVDD